ncbi:MAG: prolipoprotein diacylglyceryl transferase [Endomicrobium sp.]|jgi:phosphatidylglycerol:prolipoprotein diacylglycerol transferase|uniref:prolipoprotein diacylglyceryl transferase n=1 Tax=Candidatus Endomicrobiellum cubanum TaxID=3242325 RepID=UPI0028195DBA|nr:prolipoprotein diacylglyceryl transferase [Endomicrobium sp.]
MYPILFSFGNFRIFSYGLFVALAFIVAMYYLSYSLNRLEFKIFSQEELSSFFVYLVFFGIIGARIFYVLTNINEYIVSPLDIFKVWQGGLVYYGGFITVSIFAIIYCRVRNIQVLYLGDFFAPALALGHSIGRIGCFFSGCCYGKESNLPWAVVFTDKQSLAVLGEHLHPTQIYESLGNFCIFFILLFYSKKKRRIGNIFAIYLILYSILRFVVECFRGDDRGIQYFGLSISQNMSIILLIIGVLIYARKASLRKT